MKRKSKLLLVLAASSLFAISSCSDNPSSSNRDDGDTSEVSKTYYSIALPTGEHYTVTPVNGYNASEVEENKEFKFNVNVETGYEISSVKVSGVEGDLLPDDDGVYTIANVATNLSISVEVKRQIFKVTFSGAHFDVEPSTGYKADNIYYGGDFKFTVKLEDHYNLSAVKVNNLELTAVDGIYTIENIVSDTVVNVLTNIETFAITATGEHASISPLDGMDASKVEYGSDFKFKVLTDDHYHIEEVKVNQVSLTAVDGVYTISNVTSNVEVSLTAKIDTNSVRFEGEGFEVNPVTGYSQDNIEYGSDFKFKLTVKEHFHIVSIRLGNVDLTPDSDGVYTISNIIALTTVNVVTEEDSYKLTLPSGEHYTIELENPNMDLNTVGYSKAVKFKVIANAHYEITSVKLNGTTLVADQDGYYTVKEQTSDAIIAIETAAAKYSITFNSNGGSLVPTQTIEYGQDVTRPSDPTREGDEYYESYTFDGWYRNGEKFDFASKIESDVTLVARWAYGESKVQYVSSWSTSDFTAGETGSAATISAAGSGMAWENGAVNAEKKAQIIADFGKTDNDGIFFNPNGDKGTLTSPKINFRELLRTHSKIRMEVGAYQSWSKVCVNVDKTGTGGKTKISWNDGADSISQATRTELTFMLGSDGNVHMGFKDLTFSDPLNYDPRVNRSGNLLLTEAQANGTEGLTFSTEVDGSRHYWLGRPYAVAGSLVNVSAKTGFSVTEADTLTKTESDNSPSTAPYGNWFNPVCFEQDGIGILGMNATGSSTLSIDPIDFSSLFASNKGVKFTLGIWNNDGISYVNGDSVADLGMNEAKPDGLADYTQDTINNTWYNWSVSINPVFGVAIHNSFENTDYRFALTQGQLNGTEPLKFNLGKSVSNGLFFLLTNIVSYHI